MARYTCSTAVSQPLDNIFSKLRTFLDGNGLEVLFFQKDCLIAREHPGQVAIAKLVTIEVVVDNALDSANAKQMDVVVTNEELPFHRQNHCFQIFKKLSELLNTNCSMSVEGPQ